MEEFQERLSEVYTAKTYADLELLTRDLPDLPTSAAAQSYTDNYAGGQAGAPTSTVAVGIMGGFNRTGRWRAPRNFTALAFWGGGKIDLREAVFTGGEIKIRAFALMGGIEVIVPEDAEVFVTGVGIMGGFGDQASGVGRPNAPRIVVTGMALMGGVDVKRKSRKNNKKLES
ncbi:protein of unknown function [Streptosporangium subroseum]|uniref:DUF1707 domain-containing protein n=2 Tax=Streptosporangium subroseum TaxID=106412 RepID=A0A239J1N7_9ACTN|nr:protein of unknown function [Streptosporangium subroseum]